MKEINNVACPWCFKILTAKSIKDLKCEHCGGGLRVRDAFLKKPNEIKNETNSQFKTS